MSIVRKLAVKEDESDAGSNDLETKVIEVKSKYYYTFQVYQCKVPEMVDRFESLTSQGWEQYKLGMDKSKRQNGRYLTMDEILRTGVWPSTFIICELMRDGPGGTYASEKLLPRLKEAGYELIYETLHLVEKKEVAGSQLSPVPSINPIIEDLTSQYSYDSNAKHPLDGMWWSLPLPGIPDTITGIYLRKDFGDAVAKYEAAHKEKLKMIQ